ncbi:uncharacterized protein LOC130934008 [Arachis stenosperma]|uniref:uncharacterized protein LOC130934008 n=1 Tax=Arachis stenosperma TaxID=217475 RepID=UPI0025AD8186|nr:uncharacterized protein LOC130934008 [Arachis stenosperma]
MPLSVYDALRLPPLKRLAAHFVLADKSIISVAKIAEDVLVSIKGLTFPIDFYILEMPPNESGRPSSILLGRPFLKTSRFKLDAFSRTYSFEIDGRTVSFNLDEAMKNLPEDHSIFQCDIIDETVVEVHQVVVEETLMEQEASVGTPTELTEDTLPPQLAPDDQEPSHEQKMELKPLLPHLKYTYLEDNQKLPVIIARELTSLQEEQLLSVLRRHKKAIGWSLADIVGINSQVCEHRIFLEEGTRPVVPKKSGVTTVKNEHGELIVTIVQNAWRVCIDYKHLNQATRKDHYPLLFIDQMLDRLSVDPAKVDVIFGLLYPSSVREVLLFLGHASFYQRFMDFSKVALPLSRLLQKDVEFKLSTDCKEAFDKLKTVLNQAPIVRGPDWSQPFEIMCDASNYAVGAALAQREGKDRFIIAYASKTLDAAQSNYTTTDKELLAIVFALDKFRAYLLGTKDRSGSQNLVADHLSHLEHIKNEATPINDAFPFDSLHAISEVVPWYAPVANYLVSHTFPPNFTKHQRDKLKSESKYYIWDDPYLWRYGADQIIRRPASQLTETPPASHWTRTDCGNLPFPALVSDLVSAAGVSYKAGDTKAIIPRDDQYVPNEKYIRPPVATTSRTADPAGGIPSSST